MIVTLTAPCHWHRAVLNAGEVVDLPEDVARSLVDAGQATIASEPVTCAVEGPPADKIMTPQRSKYFKHGSRQP